ncbi:BTAD domain-containing putative transcriptional regulator [Streptomyces sp. 2A115]
MEAVDNGCLVGLGGTKQRATLGFLLLQANRVVPASHLLNALWGLDDAPTTARKILQNAVYGLRGILSSGNNTAAGDGTSPEPAMLLTQPPGYMLRVDPEQVDLHLFHKWVGLGREKHAQGAPDAAAALLRDALALWRGPALADLVEAGLEWPELAALHSTQLDVREDYFDAQLACGQHHAVLAEVETMVQAEPLRERSCGQLMLALYRCGRQADALNAYSRVRAVLVENLGLEPGRGLRQLQQAILAQDPALSLGEVGTYGALVASAEVSSSPQKVRTLDVRRRPPGDGSGTVPEQRTADGVVLPEQRAGVDRRRVSVVSVRTRLAPSLARGAVHDLDDLLDGTTQLVREQVERFGGTVTASIGSVSLALFGLDGPCEEDAKHAVLAALAIRDVLDVSAGSGPDSARLSVHASVTMGEVLMRRRGQEEALTVVGAVLDESQALLCEVPSGEVRASHAIRRASEHAVLYRHSDPSPAGWEALGVRDEESPEGGDTGGTEAYELDILRGLVKRTQHRGVPHLVTVLGEGGTGKSRLLRDFERWATGRADAPRVLTGRVSADPDDSLLTAPAQILTAYCGISTGDDAARAQATLARTVRSMFPSERTSDQLLSRLRALVATGGVDVHFGELCPGEVLDSWSQFLREAARQKPLVLCIDDLHCADDLVLDTVEELAETAGSGPLFVVAGAGPELLLRRPGWAGGKSHATTVTLDQPEMVTNEQLVEFLLSAGRGEGMRSFTEERGAAA